MTHRAEQIVEAVATAIRARLGPKGWHVYTHRADTLDPEQDEMPAISVDIGPLSVDDGEDVDVDWLDCTLSMPILVMQSGTDEKSVRASLFDGVSQIQIALKADISLGLSPDFIVALSVLGWDEPAIDAGVSPLVGNLQSNWAVKFRMHKEDPTYAGSVPNF